MAAKFVVSRKWDKPHIEAFINHEEVGARMEMEAFINAIVEECGDFSITRKILKFFNVKFNFSKEPLKQTLLDNAQHVLAEMKEATKHIV